MKKRVYIALGSNIEPKSEYLEKSIYYISQIPEVQINKLSSIYQTLAWGKTDQEDFLNQVIELETSLEAIDLLKELQNIEIKLERQRHEKWGSRTIDLDILFYGEDNIQVSNLEIPHPYVQERLFVIVPLKEINPEFVFPDGTKIWEVLNNLLDREGDKGIKKIFPADTPNFPACIHKRDQDGTKD